MCRDARPCVSTQPCISTRQQGQIAMTDQNDSSGKFGGKYLIPSARAAWWDYSAPAAYFITICTAGRAHLFGAVRDDQMILSPLGDIVREEWEKSFTIRQELTCDTFVIMPNHIHAIVRIVVETHGGASPQKTHGPVETDGRPSLRQRCAQWRGCGWA